MSVGIDPPEFSPLIEWRFDGQAVSDPLGQGTTIANMFDGMGADEWMPGFDVGSHDIEAGA